MEAIERNDFKSIYEQLDHQKLQQGKTEGLQEETYIKYTGAVLH